MHPASAPPPEFDVALRRASLRYGGAFLLRDLDFVLPGGRWTCLLGPSGVGKSSLLRVIAGLEPLAAGEVVCTDGRPLGGCLGALAPYLSDFEARNAPFLREPPSTWYELVRRLVASRAGP